jgi:hypothetical protein
VLTLLIGFAALAPMPPYFDRKSRTQFAPDRVPWLMLEWRGE